MTDIFLTKVLKAHQDCDQCPKSEEIAEFFNRLLGLLFPTFSSEVIKDKQALKDGLSGLHSELETFLLRQKHPNPREASSRFFQQVLPSVYELINKDVDAIYAGDPAATSTEEIKRSYPGFYAIASYRVAHGLLKLGVNNLPRSITENAHSRTGIDIHPG
ncbi:MAG: serine acetyltransferase, partial [Cyclobacteriaceae bacterium]